MTKRRSYTRIAITLPRAVLRVVDELARAHDRSRSWIIAGAVRRYAAEPRGDRGESRETELRRDLQLTPEARVRAAEETLRATDREAGPRRNTVVLFDRYEDFLDWKDSPRSR